MIKRPRGLPRCPKCGKPSLIITKYPGGVVHSCLNDCAYLMVWRKPALTLAILALVFLGGCTPLERTAYNMAVASKAFLNSIQSKHPECSALTFPVGGGTLCLDLSKAVAAQHLLIDAIEGYCNLTALPATDTTACAPVPKGTPAFRQFTNALTQAIAGYERAETDLKGVVQ